MTRPIRFATRRLVRAFVFLVSLHHAGLVQAASCVAPTWPGVNVSGGEFNTGTLPGRYGWDYVYPTQTEMTLARNLGSKVIRVPVSWERIQYAASTPLVETEMRRLDGVVDLALRNGLVVVLDLHNYGVYRGAMLGSAGSPPYALPDLWRRLAARYAFNGNVAFGLMNEPHDIAADAWSAIVRQTLDAIRGTGAKNTVLVPGTNWTGAHTWFNAAGSLSNASALLPLARAYPNVVFEVHEYFDDWSTGTQATCSGASRVNAALTSLGTWARTNHVRLFLGEFGVSQRPECLAAMDSALAIVERDRDVWLGWTYWAAGAWWGDYMFNVQSTSGTKAQGAVLKKRAATLNAARVCS